MLEKKTAVLGAGNGGQALAGDLALFGYDVNLYEHPTMLNKFKPIIDSKKLVYRMPSSVKAVDLALATCDLSEVLSGVNLVHVVVPALAHEIFFKELLPLLRKEMIVIVWSGRFGALRLKELCRQEGVAAPVIVEVNTLPYGVRLNKPGDVQILFTAKKLYYATVGADQGLQVEQFFNSAFPAAKKVENPIAAGFNNSALLVLPIAPVLNVGGIEKAAGQFYLFRDGVTTSVAKVMEAVYREIKAIAEHFEFTVTEYTTEDFQSRGSVETVNFEVERDDPTFYERMSGPDRVKHRYLMENIPYGLVPIAELGRKANIPTPVIDSIINLGCVLCDTDFSSNGRTLDTLGIKEAADINVFSVR